MSATAWLVVYCGLILLASVVGGLVPIYIRLTHQRMELMLSFVAGVMLGIGLLHLLPHAWLEAMAALEGGADEAEAGASALQDTMLWMLAGFLVMFLIERFFSFHQHPAPAVAAGSAAGGPADHEHHQRGREGRRHNHGHDHGDGGPRAHAHAITWTGATVGLTIHSILEGVALAGSMKAGGHAGPGAAALAGFGTFLVIVLHKPFDSMAIGALMSRGGRSPAMRHVVNMLFALAIPLGVIALELGLSAEVAGGHGLLAAALAFSGGMFVCIALSDVLPELQFHQHDRVKLSAALVLGLALAWGIARLEAGAHGLGEEAAEISMTGDDAPSSWLTP